LSTNNWTDGDLTYDGLVNSDDLTVMAGNLGQHWATTLSSEAPMGRGFTATPEPSTFVMLAAGLVSLLAYGWRRRL
jgi:hypothetical protein